MEPSTAWIQTYTGLRFYPLDPRPEQISPLDLAHHLAMKCRFGGACVRFYSVAEHSVIIARRLADQKFNWETRLWGLLHDAAEAYLPDVCRPIRPAFGELAAAEAKILAAVAQAFGIPETIPGVVWEVDDETLKAEHRTLLHPTTRRWEDLAGVVPGDSLFLGLTPSQAESAWLDVLKELLA